MRRDVNAERRILERYKEIKIEAKTKNEIEMIEFYKEIKKYFDVEIIDFPIIVVCGIVGKIISLNDRGFISFVPYQYNCDDEIEASYSYAVNRFNKERDFGAYLENVPEEKRAYHLNYFSHKENNIFKHTSH